MTKGVRALSVRFPLLVLLLAAHAVPVFASDLLRSEASFCSGVQATIVDTDLESSNVLHSDHRQFVLSKASVKPLVTHQFEPGEDALRAEAGMISCKMKTADHLQAVYGPSAAGKDIGCDGVMRVIVGAIVASLDQPNNGVSSSVAATIQILPEQTVDNGDAWLAPLRVLEKNPEGVLQIRTRGLRKDWGDARYASHREELRGVRYCHLVAPGFLKRVLSGEVTLETSE